VNRRFGETHRLHHADSKQLHRIHAVEEWEKLFAKGSLTLLLDNDSFVIHDTVQDIPKYESLQPD
jgi:hypothetical protein